MDRAGLEPGQVQQLREQVVQRRHALLDAHDLRQLGGIGFAGAQGRREQGERVQRLAQVVAGGGQEPRPRLAGGLEPRILVGQLHHRPAERAFHPVAAARQRLRGVVDAALQAAQERPFVDIKAHLLAAAEPLDGLGQLHDRARGAVRDRQAGCRHQQQSGEQEAGDAPQGRAAFRASRGIVQAGFVGEQPEQHEHHQRHWQHQAQRERAQHGHAERGGATACDGSDWILHVPPGHGSYPGNVAAGMDRTRAGLNEKTAQWAVFRGSIGRGDRI